MFFTNSVKLCSFFTIYFTILHATIFLLIFFFIRRYTNFQKRLIYSFLLHKILEILQFFQYTKIYEAMQNVGIA